MATTSTTSPTTSSGGMTAAQWQQLVQQLASTFQGSETLGLTAAQQAQNQMSLLPGQQTLQNTYAGQQYAEQLQQLALSQAGLGEQSAYQQQSLANQLAQNSLSAASLGDPSQVLNSANAAQLQALGIDPTQLATMANQYGASEILGLQGQQAEEYQNLSNQALAQQYGQTKLGIADQSAASGAANAAGTANQYQQAAFQNTQAQNQSNLAYQMTQANLGSQNLNNLLSQAGLGLSTSQANTSANYSQQQIANQLAANQLQQTFAGQQYNYNQQMSAYQYANSYNQAYLNAANQYNNVASIPEQALQGLALLPGASTYLPSLEQQLTGSGSAYATAQQALSNLGSSASPGATGNSGN